MIGLTRSAPSFLRGLLVLVASVAGAVFSVAQAMPDWIWQLHTHEGPTWSIVYAPDGEHLFTAGWDGQVRRWSLTTGEITRRYRAGSGIQRVAVSDDGTLIAGATQNHRLVVWNVETGAQLCNLPLGTYGQGVRFLPGKPNLLVATYQNAHLYEVDPHAGQFVRADPLPSAAWDMDISAEGNTVAIPFHSSTGGYVRIYDLTTRALKWQRFIDKRPYLVDISPDGSKVAVGCDPGEVRVYTTESLAHLATLPATSSGVPQFSQDGEVLYTLRRPVYGYRTSDWQKIHDFYPDSPPDTMANHPSGSTVAFAHSDSIRLYSSADMAEIGRLAPNRGRVTRWVSRPDDSQYATAHEIGDRFYAPANLWQPDTGQWLSGFNYNTESSQTLYALGYSNDGARLALATYANAELGRVVRAFDVATGALILEVSNIHTAQVNDLSYSPDSTRIATASLDKTAKVWNAQTAALIATLTGHTASVSRCFFRGNNELITVSNSGREVTHWNITTGQPIQTWTFTETIRAIYVASTDRLFVNVGYGLTCQEISLATGNVVNTIAFPGWLAAVSRDGTTLLSSGTYMNFLNASTGATLASLDNGAPGMEFTNDGSRVFTREGVIDNPVQEEYAATSLTATPPAFVASGTLASLVKPRDDDWLRLAILTFSSKAFPIIAEARTTIDVENPRALRARIRSKSNTQGAWTLSMQFFDVISGSWSTVARVAAPLSQTVSEQVLSTTQDVNRYAASDGTVRMRFTVDGLALGSSIRPDISIDYARFEVVR